MTRQPISAARASDLIFAYARQHRQSYRRTEEDAASSGLLVPAGRLVLVGGRWFLVEAAAGTRRFQVQLPRHGARTVEVPTRARLAVNLIDLGYTPVQAGRYAYQAWRTGQSGTRQRVVMQELHPGTA